MNSFNIAYKSNEWHSSGVHIGPRHLLYLTEFFVCFTLIICLWNLLQTIFALAALKKSSMEKEMKIEKEMVEVFKYAADRRKKRGN